MKLIVGLGNPGIKYKNTRHNVGFMALDKMSGDFKFNKKFNAEVSKIDDTVLAKPQTFMNLSGPSVQAVMSFYDIAPDDLTVIHDDLDIALGEFKIQKGRSSAGHNGVQSIMDSIGTKEFTRVRVGIKTEALEKIPVEKFVLQRFGDDEFDIVSTVIDQILKK